MVNYLSEIKPDVDHVGLFLLLKYLPIDFQSKLKDQPLPYFPLKTWSHVILVTTLVKVVI